MVDAVMIVALTLWLECRSESPEGMEGVATVIANRAMANDLLSVSEVCIQRFQFSCWNRTSPSIEARKITLEIRKTVQWRHCYRIADDLVRYRYAPISDWTHYYNPVLSTPPWAARLVNTLAMGRHVFGRMP